MSSAASAGGIDAFAESLGTLSVSFDPADASNLQAASAPAAVPSIGWPGVALLALSIVGVGLVLRPGQFVRS